MELKDNVQGVVLGLFGAYAGGYLADLTSQAENGNPVDVAAGLVSLQPPLLGVDLADDSVWVDTILGHLGVSSTSAAYTAAAAWANGSLDAGASRAEVIIAAVVYLLGDDVEAQYADVATAFKADVAAGVTWSEGDGKDVLGVGELREAAGNPATGGSFNLTAALATLEAANTAKADFLAGLDLDEDGEADGEDAGYSAAAQEAAVVALIDDGAAPGNPVVDFNVGTYAPATALTEDSTAAQQTTAFAAARANYDLAVATQEAAVASAQAAVDALDDDADVAAYRAALLAEDAADEVLLGAQADEAGAIASFNVADAAIAPAGNIAAADITINTTTGAVTIAVTATADYLVADNTGDIGVVEAVDGITEETNPGITAVITAINARLVAEFELQAASDDVTSTQGAVGAPGDSGLVDTLVLEEGNLADLLEEEADLEELIADVEAAYALNAQLETLDTAITDAEDAIAEDGGYTIAATLNTAADAAGGAVVNDLYLATDLEAADSFSISNFGAEGQDIIVFGSAYSLVELGDDVLATDSVGDVNALEIFWEEVAGNLVLNVETQAFAGNATGTADFATITLVGFTAAEITSFANGYLVA